MLPSITDLDRFAHAPWTSQYLQGIIDAPTLNLTPGTRLGVIYDEKLKALEEALKPVEQAPKYSDTQRKKLIVTNFTLYPPVQMQY